MRKQRKIILAAMIVFLSASQLAAEVPLSRQLLDYLGFTATPGQMRGDSPQGDVWLVDLVKGVLSPLTSEHGFHSPIFTPEGKIVLALKGEAIVRLPVDGGPVQSVHNVAHADRLVGIDNQNPNEIIVLLKEAGPMLAIVSMKDGSIRRLPHDPTSEEDQRVISQILGQERFYGTTHLFLKKNSKQTIARTLEWMDVFLQRGENAPQNVSKCDGVNCTQPAMSPDGNMVVFIREVK